MCFSPSFVRQIGAGLHNDNMNGTEFLKLGRHCTHLVRHLITLSRHQLTFYTAPQPTCATLHH